MDKTKLKKLDNLSLQGVAMQICKEVLSSRLEQEVNHPLFLQMQGMVEVYSGGHKKTTRSKYDDQVMASEQILKRTFRAFYQHLLAKASCLDPQTANAAKLIRKQLKVTASSFERQKQPDKRNSITHILSVLKRDDLGQQVALTLPDEMIGQLQESLDVFIESIELRGSDKLALKNIPTASSLRAPLIEAICKYHLHLYIDNETESNEERTILMERIDNFVDHGGPRKYTFRTRKPAQPKEKKRKKVRKRDGNRAI
ncbi:MAG: hypothetical protein Q8909_12905 [Bacteroidota bacterium]|nr:hypothetical protein [Bacteroidota bacterium]